uniref:Uncharacterized protein n=1 Tax=Anguilla anguilla TaxID=7936 RepID=A0A0E9S9C6_ANGAN
MDLIDGGGRTLTADGRMTGGVATI